MTAPKRRWSFSLRTLFVVVTLAACLLFIRGSLAFVAIPLILLFSVGAGPPIEQG